MTFERALREVGDFGRYQHLLLLFIFWTTFTCGINYYTQLFIFSLPPHECFHIDQDIGSSNSSSQSFIHKILKLAGNNSQQILDKFDIDKTCHEYFVPKSFLESLSPAFAVDADNEEDKKKVHKFIESRPCTSGWQYDHSDIFVTISSEQDWVCDKDHRPAVLNQAFWIGNVVGCFIWGLSNDFFGRRPTVIVAHLVYFAGDILTYLAPEYWSILGCRFIVGISHHTVSHLPYLLAVEYVGLSSRTAPLLALMVAYCCASLVVPFVAASMSNWRQLLAFAAAPSLVVPMLGIFRLLPESPSWLLCKGRVHLARRELQKVAKINGKDNKECFEALDEALESEMQQRAKIEMDAKMEREGGCCQYKRLLFHAILAVALCVIGFMCYYGHVENTSNLGSDLYWSFFFGALVEIPAYSVYYLVNRFGRKPILLLCALGSGLASIAYGYIPTDLSVFRLCDALSGRMFAVGIYYVALQFSLEVLPTVIRGTGAAMCEIFGGLGVFMCPQIVYLGRESPWLPLLVFGCLSFVGGAIVLFLPETRGRELPQTLRDGNSFGRKTVDRRLEDNNSNGNEEMELKA